VLHAAKQAVGGVLLAESAVVGVAAERRDGGGQLDSGGGDVSLQFVEELRHTRAVVDGADAASVGRLETGHAHAHQDAPGAAGARDFDDGFGGGGDPQAALGHFLRGKLQAPGLTLLDLLGHRQRRELRQTRVHAGGRLAVQGERRRALQVVARGRVGLHFGCPAVDADQQYVFHRARPQIRPVRLFAGRGTADAAVNDVRCGPIQPHHVPTVLAR